ncbi:MAG: heat-inducible transcription repressor HrcA [Candidatus Tyloplasma litorale]|nr:MAG: heat-inducible transcription repressor HrcA [Mycoplasmatales bacterium]
MATERQLELLKIIVSIYVKNGDPVSSQAILEIDDNHINLSSATIRKEMLELENEGYIYKLNSSSSRTSGRIPTNKGYEYYLSKIETNPNTFSSIKSKLDKILKDRFYDIEDTLNKAMSLINDATKTLTISKEFKNNTSSTIIDINCYKINDEKAIVVLITSNGEVVKKEIQLNSISFEEFEKSLLSFSKRVIGTSINEIEKSLTNLNKILSIKLKGMEEQFQNIIKFLFEKTVVENTTFQGMNNLVLYENPNVKKQIGLIFKMIENNSIWDFIHDDGKIFNNFSGVTIDMDTVEGLSIVNKSIAIGENKHKQFKILGEKNQDYVKLFSMLEYLEKKLKD